MHGSSLEPVGQRAMPVRYFHSAHPLGAELRDRTNKRTGKGLHTVVRPASYHSLHVSKPAAGSTPSISIPSADHAIDKLRRQKRILEKELAEAQMKRSQANQDRDEAVKEVRNLRAQLRRRRKKHVQDTPAAASTAAAIPAKEPSTTTQHYDENLRPLHHHHDDDDDTTRTDPSPLHSRGSSLHDNLAATSAALRAAEAKVEDLTEQLKAAVEKHTALEARVEALAQEKSALENQLEDAVHQHTQDVEDLTAEKHTTEEELEHHKSEHEAAQRKLAARDAAIEALQTELEATTERLQRYEQWENGDQQRHHELEARQGARVTAHADTGRDDDGDAGGVSNTVHDAEHGTRGRQQQDALRVSASTQGDHSACDDDDDIPAQSKQAWQMAMLKLRNMAVVLQSRLTDTQRELERQRDKCAETERRLSQTLSSHMEEKSRLKQLVRSEQARVQQLSQTIAAFREQSTRLQDELASYQVGEMPEEKERLQLELQAAREELVALQQCCQPFLMRHPTSQLFEGSGLSLQQMYPDPAATMAHASSSSSLSAKTGVQSAPTPSARRPHSLHLPCTRQPEACMEGPPLSAGPRTTSEMGSDTLVALRAARAKNMALSRANQRLQEQVAYLQRQLLCHDPKGQTTPL